MEKESKILLNSIPELINKTFPVPGKFRGALPSDIAELSRLLTNSRGERSLSYLTRPNYLSAYLHYFLPWNLYRLCILLPSLNLKLSADDTVADLGCGPLTFASALWITRPDLRAIPLEFNCVDRSAPVMEAGKKLFLALAGQTGSENSCTWKINLIKKDININKSAGHNEASLVCAVNMFNEQYDRIPHNNTQALRETTKSAALFMHGETSANGSILTVEPGVPQSGRFILFLREALAELGRLPSAPCPHTTDCPLSRKQQRQPPAVKQRTKKERWCHFAFETADAPKDLQRLSTAAKLPKERITFSFLLTEAVNLAGIQTEAKKREEPLSAGQTGTRNAFRIRVLSDAFPLPGNRFGRYGCSAKGLVLLTGDMKRIEKTSPLTLIEENKYFITGEHDAKSGALITELK